MTKIKTTRFGEIEVSESDIIVMKGCILGFDYLKRYILLIQNENTPLWWLQAVDDPAIAFVVVNPRTVKPDYNPTVFDEDLEFLGIESSDDIALLSIVTVRLQPFRVTANIKAPILINAANRLGKQIVLEDPGYPIQYEVLIKKEDFSADLSPCGTDRLSLTAVPR